MKTPSAHGTAPQGAEEQVAARPGKPAQTPQTPSKPQTAPGRPQDGHPGSPIAERRSRTGGGHTDTRGVEQPGWRSSPAGRSVLVSAEFARLCPAGLAPIGDFRLPGIDGTQYIFGLADERWMWEGYSKILN